MLCDVTSIRATCGRLLRHSVSAQYVTREGDQSAHHEAGNRSTLHATAACRHDPNLFSPFDSASRVRTPRRGPRSRA